MKRATLKFVHSLTHPFPDAKPLRTDIVTGYYVEQPRVGWSFVLFAPPLHEGDYRQVTTSVVREVTASEHGFQIRTMNSRYEVVHEPDV